MTSEEFIILAGKVADGTASIPEIALYNASYESFQQDRQMDEEENQDGEADHV